MSKLTDILTGVSSGPVSDCCGVPITYDEVSKLTCSKCGKPIKRNWHTGSFNKQLIVDLFLELIGEDDSTGLEQPDSKFWAHTGRNDLRKELRQKASEL